MASEVDIANLALSHLGDTSTVSNLDPPEGSAQAEHCARFYPIARDSLLEMHTWGFATKRVTLAQLGSGWPEWDYCYAQPADAVNIIAVLPPQASDDYSEGLSNPWIDNVPASAGGYYVPQAFSCEILDSGAEVIYTDQPDAILRYTGLVTDTTKFSPLFVVTLSHYLASMLAGPVLKGDVGSAEAKRQSALAQGFLAKARESDSSQRRINPKHSVSWISGR